MSDEEENETILGEFSATTKLELGSETLRLIFTSLRILVDHVGKRGTGAVAGSGIFGMLSSGLENLFKSSRESIRKKSLGDLDDPGKILQTHKDNFALTYAEIVNVTLTRMHWQGSKISILTRDDKYEFMTGTKFDTVIGLFRHSLADKLTVRTVK
jgi:hypothetical protein